MEKPKEEANLEIVLKPIGIIRSPITEPGKAPRLGSESAVSGKLIVDERYMDALFGLEKGWKIVIVYWMHLAQRDILQVHPRGDRTRPLRGVFSTRSPQRPNPISLDTVEITGIKGAVIDVIGLDAVDGTPLLDIKCVV
ncbi:MAG: tRNA (N6-threonylcarbamoyladenosine(37)-N6)-methyltransferase TrmO [Syntrophobacteraceae bacterium]|jgi:tRNA-Thr(GGU) m(6)t(6)A37 methyltransferase TsaA